MIFQEQFASKIKRKLFRYCEKIRHEPVFEKFDELRFNQTQSKEFIEVLQLKKFKALLIHAYKYSPFYKKFYDMHDISPYNVHAWNDINKLPILTKKMIRDNVKTIQTNSDLNIYSVKTSGSTGAPLNFFKDRIASAYSYAAMYRGHKWYGVDICDREAYLWGIPFGKKDYYIARLRDCILNRFREKAFNLTDKVNFDFYKKMIYFRPKILSGYSTLLYEFARFIDKNGLDVRPIKLKMVKYTAEVMHDYQRELISKTFLCPIVSEYGSAETGIIAFQCIEGSNHIMSDCVHVDFQEDYNTKNYKIIATNLNSYGFPIIKYDTGDLVKTNKIKSCSCGLPFPVINKIIGRCSDLIKTPEGLKIHSNIFSYIIKELIKKHKSLMHIRFVHKKINTLYVYVTLPNCDYKRLVIDLKKAIHEKISNKMIINVVSEQKPRRDKSGKLRYFVSELHS
jgi:phenylacetate-CoA ligase